LIRSFARIKARKGAAIAIKATARKLAGLYYTLFSKGMHYVDYEDKLKQQQIKFLMKKANELNLQLSVI
jgi:transposase